MSMGASMATLGLTLAHFLLCFLAAADERAPTWDVPGDAPDPERGASCGFRALNSNDLARHSEVYRATPSLGTYNHAAMIDYHDDFFLVSWKNSPRDEEQPGQRVLYSTSTDGVRWTPTDGSNVLFPNISTTSSPAFLFAAPSLIVRGRRYAAATHRQYSIFPPPRGDDHFLLLREVRRDRSLGDVFWATEDPPKALKAGAALKGVKVLGEMDARTRADIALLWNSSYLPCSYSNSLKCEAVLGQGLPAGEHEAAHWAIPGGDGEELALFRSPGIRQPLRWAHRASAGAPWSAISVSNIPDIGSNINAGQLPSGSIFLLSNACPKPWRRHKALRDPLVASLSVDGFSFTSAVAVTSCGNNHLRSCWPRHPGFAKTATAAGPAYPQAATVTGKGPDLDGLYVVFSNNKEDIWVVKVAYEALIAPASLGDTASYIQYANSGLNMQLQNNGSISV